jgi:hypothetical protein
MISDAAKEGHALCGALADWFDSQGASFEEATIVMSMYSGMILARYDPAIVEAQLDMMVEVYRTTLISIASGIRGTGASGMSALGAKRKGPIGKPR